MLTKNNKNKYETNKFLGYIVYVIYAVIKVHYLILNINVIVDIKLPTEEAGFKVWLVKVKQHYKWSRNKI